MKLSATVKPHHEELYWAYHRQFKGNKNDILSALFNSALLAEALLRRSAETEQLDSEIMSEAERQANEAFEALAAQTQELSAIDAEVLSGDETATTEPSV